MRTLTGTLEVTDWQEDTLEEAGGVRTTRVEGAQSFSGGIEGQGHVTRVMCYLPDGSARFVRLQRIDGSVEGRRGTLAIESTGDHDGTSSTGSWRIVEGSGTGALTGLTGSGGFRAPSGTTVDYELELDEPAG